MLIHSHGKNAAINFHDLSAIVNTSSYPGVSVCFLSLSASIFPSLRLIWKHTLLYPSRSCYWTLPLCKYSLLLAWMLASFITHIAFLVCISHIIAMWNLTTCFGMNFSSGQTCYVWVKDACKCICTHTLFFDVLATVTYNNKKKVVPSLGN